MKYIIKNLKIFIKTERIIFFLIIICVACSALIINFSYGLYQNYNVIIREDNLNGELETSISFQMKFYEDKYLDKKKLTDTVLKLSDNITDNCFFYIDSYAEDLQNEIDKLNSTISTYDTVSRPKTVNSRFILKDDTFNIQEVYFFNISNPKNGLLGQMWQGRVFTNEEEQKGAEIVITDNENFSVGENIVINGKTYNIVGFGGIPHFQVPFLSLDNDTEITNVIMYFFDTEEQNKFVPITRKQYNEIKNTFEKELSEFITVPELNIPNDEITYFYNTIILISILISIIAAIILAVLYKYILLKRSKQLTVFRLCGCTKLKAVLIYLSECLFISVPVFLISTLIYAKIFLPIFAERFENMQQAYSMTIYAIIFAIYFIICSITLLIMFITSVKKQELIKIGRN